MKSIYITVNCSLMLHQLSVCNIAEITDTDTLFLSLGIIVPHNVYQYKRHSIDRIIKQFSNTLQKAKE